MITLIFADFQNTT